MREDAATKQIGPLGKKGTINTEWLDENGYTLYLDYQPQVMVEENDGTVISVESAVVFMRPAVTENGRIDVIVFHLTQKGFGFNMTEFSGLWENQISVPHQPRSGTGLRKTSNEVLASA